MRENPVCSIAAAVVLAFFAIAVCAAAEPDLVPGMSFPRLAGESLNGNEVVLPDAAVGKVSLIVFTFSKAAGDRSRQWTENFVRDFPDDSRVTSYSVSMLSDVPGFLRTMVRSAIRKGTPEKLWSRTLIVTSDDSPWKQRLGVTSDKHPYLVLLNGKGQVVWLFRGEFDSNAYQSCKMRIAELSGAEKK